MTLAANLFSDTYLKFTQVFSRIHVREDGPEIRIPEKTIRCIWNDQLFRTADLKTTDDENLEVIFPGYWNFGSGPDFKNAAIKVDGKTLEGDVEIHVYATDWKAHGHSSNPDFDNVILHVFMWKGRGSEKRRMKSHGQKSHKIPGAHIFELEVKNFLTKGILELNDELDFDSYPILNQFNYGRCHKPLAGLTQKRLVHLLNAAGEARVFTKMERFHDRIILNGYEQTFYEGVAEALGYPINKLPFQTLAERLPLATLKNALPEKTRKSELVLHVQAMMFGIAGFMDSPALDPKNFPPGERKYFSKLEKLWRHYCTLIPCSTLKAEDWKFARIRPANYPYRRIAALAHLVVRHQQIGMFENYIKEFTAVINQSGNKGYAAKIPKTVYSFFCVDSKDYWSTHFTPGGKKISPLPFRDSKRRLRPDSSSMDLHMRA